MHNHDRLIGTSRLVVRAALILNRLFLLAVCVGLILSWIFAALLPTFLARSNPGVDANWELTGLRLLMLVGLVTAVATDRLLTALRQVVASAGIGDPFLAANGRRLRTIGWSLLVLQLLDIPVALLGRFFPDLGSTGPTGCISIGGWIAVLMVFVLSRVFAAGSVMRDELEATV